MVSLAQFCPICPRYWHLFNIPYCNCEISRWAFCRQQRLEDSQTDIIRTKDCRRTPHSQLKVISQRCCYCSTYRHIRRFHYRTDYCSIRYTQNDAPFSTTWHATCRGVSMPTQTDVSTDEVRAAPMSFRSSSAGGIYGFRPGHLKYLACRHTAQAGRRLNQSLAAPCIKLLDGDPPNHLRNILFSARLKALRTKNSDIRQIAVGNVLRRLASKIVVRCMTSSLRNQMSHLQLGVGVRGTSNAAIHAIRSVLDHPPLCEESMVLIKL